MTAGPTGRPLGWYVHHHGSGHSTRLLSIAEHLDREIVVFSSAEPPGRVPERMRWVLLPRDDDEPDGGFEDATVGGLLHWVPLNHVGHRSRLAMLAHEIDRAQLCGFVVDVSVEVTLFTRLLGLPVVVVGQPGDRRDLPHRLAYRAARTVLAPWPAAVAVVQPGLPAEADGKTAYVGGISRFAGRERTRDPEAGSVVVLGSAGGNLVTAGDVRAAARSCPGTSWSAPGLAGGGSWLDDPWDLLCGAEVVVSFAGQNAVADLAAAGARAIVIAQPRPFDEQQATALAVGAVTGVPTLTGWPAPEAWPSLLAEVAAAPVPNWEAWQTGGAAQRAAAVIDRLLT